MTDHATLLPVTCPNACHLADLPELADAKTHLATLATDKDQR